MRKVAIFGIVITAVVIVVLMFIRPKSVADPVHIPEEIPAVESSSDHIPEESYQNPNAAYANVYQSNIDMSGEVDVDLEEYTWYTPLASEEMGYWYLTHQYIAYSIDKYYSGNVPDTFTCTLPDAIIHSETNMINTIRVQGSSIELDILLDLYNRHVIVTEVGN